MQLKQDEKIINDPGAKPVDSYYTDGSASSYGAQDTTGTPSAMDTLFGNYGQEQGRYTNSVPGQGSGAPGGPVVSPYGSGNILDNNGTSSTGSPNSVANNPYNGPRVDRPGPNEAVIHTKSGVNPLFIIVPIILILGILVVTQVKKIFGDANYTPGTLTDTTYTNEFFGFKAQYGKEYNLSGKAVSPDWVKSQLDNDGVVEEFSIKRDESLEALSFSVANMRINSKTSSRIKDGFIDQIHQSLIRNLESQGYSVTSDKKETMTIAGKLCEGYIITGDYNVNGRNFQVSNVVFFMFEGNYVGVISSASTSEGKAKLLINNNFTKYE